VVVRGGRVSMVSLLLHLCLAHYSVIPGMCSPAKWGVLGVELLAEVT
jgi:hypothetical protein